MLFLVQTPLQQLHRLVGDIVPRQQLHSAVLVESLPDNVTKEDLIGLVSDVGMPTNVFITSVALKKTALLTFASSEESKLVASLQGKKIRDVQVRRSPAHLQLIGS